MGKPCNFYLSYETEAQISALQQTLRLKSRSAVITHLVSAVAPALAPDALAQNPDPTQARNAAIAAAKSRQRKVDLRRFKTLGAKEAWRDWMAGGPKPAAYAIAEAKRGHIPEYIDALLEDLP